MPLLSFYCCPSNPFFKPQRGGNMRMQGVGCRQNGEEWSVSLKCVQVVRCHQKIFIHVPVRSSSLNVAFCFVIVQMHYSDTHGTPTPNIHKLPSEFKKRLKLLQWHNNASRCSAPYKRPPALVLHSYLSTLEPTVHKYWSIQISVQCLQNTSFLIHTGSYNSLVRKWRSHLIGSCFPYSCRSASFKTSWYQIHHPWHAWYNV